MKLPQNYIPRILIMGMGNLTMGDGGIGVHVLNKLKQLKLPENVDLLDIGNRTFHLSHYCDKYRGIIMVDATLDNHQPGTIMLSRPRFLKDFNYSLSTQNIRLKGKDRSPLSNDKNSGLYLLTVTAKDVRPSCPELSPEIKCVVPRVITEIESLAIKLAS